MSYSSYAKGGVFEEEFRNAWKKVTCWRRRLRDGPGLENPGDSLILTDKWNFLIELKNTNGDRFKLSMLEEKQKEGLISFDKAVERNVGLVVVNFEKKEDTIAFRFTDSLVYMSEKGRNYIKYEEFKDVYCLSIPDLELEKIVKFNWKRWEVRF